MSPSKQSLSSFPFLTEDDFRSACQIFLEKVHRFRPLDSLSWSIVHFGQSGLALRVQRNIVDVNQHDDATEEETLGAVEDDQEAFIRTASIASTLQVEYNVVLSSSYQVPVLYFSLRGLQKGPVDLDTVYRCLVPAQYKKELRRVGVVGGISFGYHPGSGAPAFFVHPCNTADAMVRIVGKQGVTPLRYLIIWLGLVGNCVGLRVPHEPFASDIMQVSNTSLS